PARVAAADVLAVADHPGGDGGRNCPPWCEWSAATAAASVVVVSGEEGGGMLRLRADRPRAGLALRLARPQAVVRRDRQAAGARPAPITVRPPSRHGYPGRRHRRRLAHRPSAGAEVSAAGRGAGAVRRTAAARRAHRLPLV